MKVFKLELWLKSMLKRNKHYKDVARSLLLGWPIILDGLTYEEINKRGFITLDDWMGEVDEDGELIRRKGGN